MGLYSKIATKPELSKGRLYSELPTGYRNSFQRDKDRLIHSNAFRRMQYKTQVFVNYEGDHFRNRLTHSIEVASVSRSLARALGLSEDLAECVALAHDLGHTPFGHDGETVLNDCMKDFGGFSHNTHAIKLITKLEKRYAAYDGLNLSWEVIEGTAKHNGPIDSDIEDYIAEYDKIHYLDLKNYSSAEAQVAALADDIAYHCHDLEDGIRAGLYEIYELEEIEFMRSIVRSINERFFNLDKTCKIYEISRELAHVLINDLLTQTNLTIADLKLTSPEDVRQLGKPLVSFSTEVNSYLKQIKSFLFKRVYKHSKVALITYKCKKVVKTLFDIYFTNPECMPQEWYQKAIGDEKTKANIIADYIAGMTDRYAIKEYLSLTGFSFDQSF